MASRTNRLQLIGSDLLDVEGPGLALSLVDEDASERTLRIRRADLAPMLAQRPISGEAAYAALMPVIGG